MKNIGIIGIGFVGNAVLEGMFHAFDINWYDKFKNSKESYYREGLYCRVRYTELVDLVNDTDGPIFVCVPTPMKKDGSCDISVVEEVVNEIDFVSQSYHIETGRKKVVIIKSTVVPGTTEKLNNKVVNIQCVFNPEFLREASSVEDFKKQDRIIIGGPHEAVTLVKQMYQQAYPEVPTTKTSSTIAEMVKYVTNCFLACKVSFANEIYQICRGLEIDYDKVVEYATKDPRLGTSHWSVPGPMPASDGSGLQPGYGGSCFVKDLNALIALAKILFIDPKVMDAAWQKNLEVRPGKDWEKLIGRAVKDEI